MATRDLTVRLRADVEGYKRAMRDAARATGDIERQGMAVQRAGRAMSSFGANMTRRVTVPILAAGAAAAKLSMDFDTTFGQMVGIAGVAADEVDGLKEAVLNLAGETGRAPQELAEALYFIRSAGLDGQDALDALDVSARAAASGLGSTVEVANAVTSAINAYGVDALDAATATDVLVRTVTEGKVAASEMAPQFGRLLPIAAELGISFEDVGAGMAFLTRSSGDASQSATSLAGVMNKLLKPSQQGAEALQQIGMDADGLRESISERGLHGTLTMLRERMSDSGFNMLFEDAQALRGALQLTGVQADEAAAVFDSLADSSGALDEAFDATDTGARDMQKAWAEIQASLIRIGAIIAPFAADLARLIGAAVEVFGKLPEPVLQAVTAFAALAAAAGPALWIVGKLTTAWGTLLPMLSRFAVPSGAVAGSMNQGAAAANAQAGAMSKLGAATRVAGIGLAAVGAAMAIDAWADEKTARRVEGLAQAFLATGEALDLVTEAAEADFFAMADLDGVFDKLLETNIEAAARLADHAEANGVAAEQVQFMREQIELKSAADAQSAEDAARSTSAVGEQGDAMSEAAAETEEAVAALQAYADQLQAQFDPLFGMLDALNSNAEAQAAVTEAQNELTLAVAEYGATSPEATAAQQALSEAQRQATGSALDVTAATASLNAAIAQNPALLDSSKAQLATWVSQGLITQETADSMAAQFDATALRAVALGNTDPDVQVSATDEATGVIGGIQAAIDRLPAEKQVRIRGVISNLPLNIGNLFGGGRATGGPVSSGKLYEVNEGGAAELFRSGGRTYLLPGESGHVAPAGQMTAAGLPADPGPSPAARGGTVIENVTVQTPDPPRQWLDELSWRMAPA